MNTEQEQDLRKRVASMVVFTATRSDILTVRFLRSSEIEVGTPQCRRRSWGFLCDSGFAQKVAPAQKGSCLHKM